MKFTVSPMDEAAQRTLSAQSSSEGNSSTTATSTSSNKRGDTQLQRLAKKLDRYIRRRQLALAESQLAKLNLSPSTTNTQESAETTHTTPNLTNINRNHASSPAPEHSDPTSRAGNTKLGNRQATRRQRRNRLKAALNQRRHRSRSIGEGDNSTVKDSSMSNGDGLPHLSSAGLLMGQKVFPQS